MRWLGLEDRVVVVTGGGSGIGRAATAAFLSAGASVMICGRSATKLATTVKELPRQVGVPYERLAMTRCDMSRPREVQRLMQRVLSRFGRLDVMVNNAGEATSLPLLRIALDDINHSLRCNLTTVILGTLHAAQAMRGGGAIINVASFAGRLGVKGKSLYSSAKAAVIAFTKVAAGELALRRIRVNCVVPGVIETAMVRQAIRRDYARLVAPIALQRFGAASEVAEGIIYLASGRAGYITGAALEITGGKFVTQP